MAREYKDVIVGLDIGTAKVMVVVAVIGILSAVAYPSYQDYVLRSRISEAVGAME